MFLVVLQLFVVTMSISGLLVLGLIGVLAVIVPAAELLEPSISVGRSGVALVAFLACELALTTVLWRLSSGGWYNYALQAVIIACVLTGRAMATAFQGTTSWHRLIPAAVAVMAVPAFAFTDVKEVVGRRRAERALVLRLVAIADRPPSEVFFVDRPGENRINGRPELVYDSWLYTVFESVGLAEPRSIWLEQVLSAGPVTVVAARSSGPKIDGLARTLPELGYRAARKVGPFFVWTR